MPSQPHPPSSFEASSERKPYSQRTAQDYIGQIQPSILQTLDHTQLEEIHRILQLAIPKPAPKIVDLRFAIDVILSRFYVVLFVGKENRIQPRKYPVPPPLTRIGNFVTAIILLISLNLLISASLAIGLYLVKSAVGINLFPGHLSDIVHDLLK